MSVKLTNAAIYQAFCEDLVEARAGFFSVLRDYLRPERRVDAQRLGDAFYKHPAREIRDLEWIENPSRGYVTILEDDFRAFRVSLNQQGRFLRVGLMVPYTTLAERYGTPPTLAAEVLQRLFSGVIPHPVVALDNPRRQEVYMEWQWEEPLLYDSALAMEGVVFLVGAVFERAIQLFSEEEYA